MGSQRELVLRYTVNLVLWCMAVFACGPWPQVQLDGTVRASGIGIPPWTAFIKDLPELSSVRTKFTDGAGI